MGHYIEKCGAGGGNRTHTALRPRDFKSARDDHMPCVNLFENSRNLLAFLAFRDDRSQPQTTATIRAKPQLMGSVQAQSPP
jgi:hypothetical protein